ncbi:MAG: SGNH/GDSL hydrolase family protein [Lachnospiraceae bacterium]|nr:SGNH/GDSL hydrolase family protein [Lachnospiraceae bacterium]
MIFQGIDFHNVDNLREGEFGFCMCRVPEEVRLKLDEGAREDVSFNATGVELRFKIKKDKATLILHGHPEEEALTAFIYYGAFQGGWEHSMKAILMGREDTEITIPAPPNLKQLKKITEDQHLGFNPEVVRVILPYGKVDYVGILGEVEPPAPEDVPDQVLLSYGSSITHGSLGLGTPHSYVFRMAQLMHCDYYNYGYPGWAHMEPELAEYFVSRKDWTLATIELGVNMLSYDYETELIRERIDGFVKILAGDGRKVFMTNIFGFNNPGEQHRAEEIRGIVRETAARYKSNRLIFTEGQKLLNQASYISADLIHPSLEGQWEIARNWYDIIRDTY